MSQFEIRDADLANLKDKVVLVTGWVDSLVLSPELFLFLNVTLQPHVCDWEALRSVFQRTVEREGRLDAVFANAGINPRTRFIDDEFDAADGQLKGPDLTCVETNLYGVISTVKLGVHHMRAKDIKGNIVITASVSSWTRFGAVDYTTSKHAVLGFMRGLLPHLSALPSPIRINCIAPNWTESGIVREEIVAPTGFALSSPAQVARSVGVLMSDAARDGEVIFVDGGKYWEIGKSLEANGVGSLVGPTMPEGSAGGTDWDRYVEFCRRMNIALGMN
ncbi:short-chain dehydrogenase [Colletotrichum karsti]|uniref:Short-chain dehydrogenase n=1 Tax=Colletotrichum karsti TaxID=1095194 RepID=A0A9P6HZV4_9PEZI|nr:short-chain dehydrogenase [Colletotrichum karsti]KAF9871431.1 short-chain dehydrogenase [Colletotrichum karsti]